MVNKEMVQEEMSLEDLAALPAAMSTAMEALLHLMHERFLPALTENACGVSDTAHKDLTGKVETHVAERERYRGAERVHRFMAALTAAVSRAQGRTVLYVPPKMLPDGDGHHAVDKDLLRRAESLVIHWTRQIKEMIHQSESVISHFVGREPRSTVCSGGRVECSGGTARRNCLLAKTARGSECLAQAARVATDS